MNEQRMKYKLLKKQKHPEKAINTNKNKYFNAFFFQFNQVEKLIFAQIVFYYIIVVFEIVGEIGIIYFINLNVIF